MSWLIDGQQRVITLARTMDGDEGIDVVFHPERDEFRLANAATRNDRNWFRIAELWDDEMYRQLRRAASGLADKREAQLEKVRRILEYEVPLVRMVDHSFDDAVKAFTRINTLGVRLKLEDIESAKIAARHSGFTTDEVIPFLESLKQHGFTRVSVMHLFRACPSPTHDFDFALSAGAIRAGACAMSSAFASGGTTGTLHRTSLDP